MVVPKLVKQILTGIDHPTDMILSKMCINVSYSNALLSPCVSTLDTYR